MKRTSIGFAAAALLAFASAFAHADDYPAKPVRLMVPYTAGGGVDNVARIVANSLGARLKQPVIIENRGGANGNIGANLAAKAAPDGYTLLMGATFLAFNRATMKDVPYDALNDLVPVALTGRAPMVLVVPTSMPVKNVGELVAYLKANPDKASYGAVGAGSPTTLLFAKATGTKAVQVLYKGGSAAMPDLLSGRLTYMIQTSSEVVPHVKGGKLRALAVTGNQRLKALPDVPTMKEAGVPDIDITGWWGVFVPKKTPQPIIDKLSREIQSVMKEPAVVDALAKNSVEAQSMTEAEFTPFFRSELRSYDAMAKEFHLSVE